MEGESEEFRLLKHIFTNVLDYNYIPLKMNKVIRDEFKSKNNSNSTVIVANTSNSNIKSIIEDTNYQDKLYNILKEDFKRSLKNVPIYILWDRDPDSNNENIVFQVLKKYSSALDNGYGMNGILLLSYPCVESYEISNFDKQLYKKKFSFSHEAKELFKFKRYSLSNINEETIINAIGNMHRSMLNYGIEKYDPSRFSKINELIFKKENEIYNDNKLFNALSLISVMLVDLGIIVEMD